MSVKPIFFKTGSPNELAETDEEVLDEANVPKAIHDRRVQQLLAVPGGTTIQSVGFRTTWGLEGTLSADDTNAGGHLLNHASDATNPSDAGLVPPSYDLTRPLWLPDLTLVVKTGASLASCVLWVGLASAALDGVTNPNTSLCAAFCFRSASDGANWRAVTSNGTAALISVVDPITTSTRYVLRVKLGSDGTWRFYMDGLLVAEHATNGPASSTPLGILARIRTIAAASKSIAWGRVALLQA